MATYIIQRCFSEGIEEQRIFGFYNEKGAWVNSTGIHSRGPGGNISSKGVVMSNQKGYTVDQLNKMQSKASTANKAAMESKIAYKKSAHDIVKQNPNAFKNVRQKGFESGYKQGLCRVEPIKMLGKIPRKWVKRELLAEELFLLVWQ